MIDIPSLAGCARMEYVAAHADPVRGLRRLVVGRRPVADLGHRAHRSQRRRAEPEGHAAGLTWLGTQPLNFSWVAPVSDTQVWTATFGAFDFTTNAQTAPDAIWSINPVTESGTMSIQGGAFNLGRTAFLATPPTLFVPDADAAHPLVHVLDLGGAPAVDIDANPSQHLPPREVAWY